VKLQQREEKDRSIRPVLPNAVGNFLPASPLALQVSQCLRNVVAHPFEAIARLAWRICHFLVPEDTPQLLQRQTIVRFLRAAHEPLCAVLCAFKVRKRKVKHCGNPQLHQFQYFADRQSYACRRFSG